MGIWFPNTNNTKRLQLTMTNTLRERRSNKRRHKFQPNTRLQHLANVFSRRLNSLTTTNSNKIIYSVFPSNFFCFIFHACAFYYLNNHHLHHSQQQYPPPPRLTVKLSLHTEFNLLQFLPYSIFTIDIHFGETRVNKTSMKIYATTSSPPPILK